MKLALPVCHVYASSMMKSALVCEEHEVMKDDFAISQAPRWLHCSNYFQLPHCENVNLQRHNGLWSRKKNEEPMYE